MKTKSVLGLLAVVGMVLSSSGAGSTNDVSDVTALTNALRTSKSPKLIRLAKGVYDVSECRSEICSGQSGGNWSSGRLSFPSGAVVTLAGAPGTRRGDVVITAPTGSGRCLLYVNKGSLTMTNVTFTGATAGGIRINNPDATLSLTDCVFSNLTAATAPAVFRYYSGVASSCPDVYRDCLFADNHATAGSVGAHHFRGGVAYNCVYTNNSCTASGGAVAGGSFVDCTFIDNRTSSTSTAAGGGAIGTDYDAHVGFCSGCTFIGNKLTGGSGAHGALTNCVFRGNEARSNSIIASAGDVVGCVFEENTSSNCLVETATAFQRCAFIGNRTEGRVLSSSTRFANCLFASNRCTTAQGILNGRIYNSTFVGNYCNSGRVSDSIVAAEATAFNCLFYQNKAHDTAYLDMALRFTKDDLETPISPYMTNCLWTVETTRNNTHREAALARTKDSQRMDAGKIRFAWAGEHPYALVGGSAARYAGCLDDDVREAVGETDLAGNPRIDGARITLGCYQWSNGGFLMLFR